MSVLGRNIVGEFFGCPSALLNDVLCIESKMVGAAQAAHATVISATFHHFSPFGVSGVVVIQESHLAIHTWPEYGYAALDVFTCGDTIDPWDIYKFLHAELQVENGSAIELGRGQRQLLNWQPLEGTPRRGGTPPPAPLRNIWFTELAGDVGLSLRHAGAPLLRTQSAHQKIEVFDTLAYGRALVLDGMVMATEQDEYVYHEMAVHPALLTHPAPRRVLVIGGGDGGVSRELCRHAAVEAVVVVEIDEAVIEASRRHLPTMSRGLLHPKVKLIVADGVQYVRDAAVESFEVIIVDSSLPLGAEKGRFSPDFFAQARRLLSPNGVLIAQAESPRHNPATFAEIYAGHVASFGSGRVFPYLISVPTYPSGQWSLLYSTVGPGHPLKSLDAERARRFSEEHRLRYYSDEIHRAAFALPSCVKELLRND